MSQLSVLLADDNAPIREMMACVLRARFTVQEPVANGKQLVEAALVRQPDVIVTDVWMPVLNGFEALRILRELGRSMPFVMVSADADIGVDCLAAGATAFVTKLEIEHELVQAVVAAAAGIHHRSVPRSDEMLRSETFVSDLWPRVNRNRPEKEA